MRAARRSTATTAVDPSAGAPAAPVTSPRTGPDGGPGAQGEAPDDAAPAAGARQDPRPPGAGDRQRTAESASSAAASAVETATRRWRASLVEMVGGSSLSDVGLLGEAIVDLSKAHPNGVASLFAGRPTRLSNLVREGEALPAARRRARAVAARAAEHASRYGVAPTYLAIGVATWTEHEDGPEVPFGGGGPQRHDVAALARVASTGTTAGTLPGSDTGPDLAADDAGAPADAAEGDAASASESTGPSRAAGDDGDIEAPALTSSIPVVSMASREPAAAPRATPSDPDAAPPAGRVVHAPVVLRPVTLTDRKSVV